jgi:hypothetical protein
MGGLDTIVSSLETPKSDLLSELKHHLDVGLGYANVRSSQ